MNIARGRAGAKETALRPHVYRLRVFWEDTDAGGIVYYANYLKFAERARTELLRALGVSQRKLAESGGPVFAVRRVQADFLEPARLDDELAVETEVTGVRGASADMSQIIRRGDADLARMTVRIACVGPRGRPTRFPPAISAAFSELAGY